MVLDGRRTVRFVPSALGNTDGWVVIRRLSADEKRDFFDSFKAVGEESYRETTACKVAVAEIGGFSAIGDDGEVYDIADIAQLLEIPGIEPLISEIVKEFMDLNFLGEERKNVSEPSTL